MRIPVLVDALGNPLKSVLTGGAAGDTPQAIPPLARRHATEVIADRGYDADATRASIEGRMRATATIPPHPKRPPRACDYTAYKERHLIACFIGKRKHFRRVFSRFDRYASRFLASIHFASTTIWLR